MFSKIYINQAYGKGLESNLETKLNQKDRESVKLTIVAAAAFLTLIILYACIAFSLGVANALNALSNNAAMDALIRTGEMFGMLAVSTIIACSTFKFINYLDARMLKKEQKSEVELDNMAK